MFCANCGKQIKDGSKFCLYCGAAQGAAPAPVTPPPRVAVQPMQQPIQPQPAAVAVNPKKKKPVAAIVAVVLVVVAALAVAGYFVVLPKVHRHQWQTGMQEAGQALAAQNYRSAVRTLEETDEILPDQPETKVQLARAYAGMGDLDKAETYMQELSDARVSAVPYTEEIENVPPRFDFYRSKEGLLEIGKSEIENGEKTVYSFYYSEPDENTYCLTVWANRENSRFKQSTMYFTKEWKPLKQVQYNEDGTVDTREELTYDAQNNMVQYAKYNGDEIELIENNRTYDENGNNITNEFIYSNQDGSFGSRTMMTLDTDGNILKRVYIDENGRATETNDMTYDASGNMLTDIVYDRNGLVTNRKEYTYDADGNELTCISYDANGLVKERTESTYDANCNELSYITYDANGGILSGHRYTYDENGNPIKKTTLNEDGTETVRETYTYTYDNNGNALSENLYYVQTDTTVRYEYTYNETDDEVTTICYNEDGSIQYKETMKSGEWYTYTEHNDVYGNAKSKSTATFENGYFTGWTKWNKDDGATEERYYYIDPALLKATMVE